MESGLTCEPGEREEGRSIPSPMFAVSETLPCNAESKDGRFDPEPFRASLRAYLVRRGAHHDADDLVQETFLRSLQQPPKQEPAPWLFRIAGNLLADRRRSNGRRAAALPTLARDAEAKELTPDALARAAADDAVARAFVLLRDLPARQRAALELRLIEHLDYDEVGARLGCTGATARQHYYLAMKALRAALGADARTGDRR